jgi:hypothetical protein
MGRCDGRATQTKEGQPSSRISDFPRTPATRQAVRPRRPACRNLAGTGRSRVPCRELARTALSAIHFRFSLSFAALTLRLASACSNSFRLNHLPLYFILSPNQDPSVRDADTSSLIANEFNPFAAPAYPSSGSASGSGSGSNTNAAGGFGSIHDPVDAYAPSTKTVADAGRGAYQAAPVRLWHPCAYTLLVTPRSAHRPIAITS